jgi:hypothetical protein
VNGTAKQNASAEHGLEEEALKMDGTAKQNASAEHGLEEEALKMDGTAKQNASAEHGLGKIERVGMKGRSRMLQQNTG